jgi:glycosyltransferase involved in cell wall biosynthesis
MNRPVYLIITTQNIGGVEKRLLGIWLKLKYLEDSRYELIISRALFDKAQQIGEFEHLQKFKQTAHFDLVADTYLETQRNIRQFASCCPIQSIFHFVLSPPLYRLKRHMTLLTYPTTSFGKYNIIGLLTLFNGLRLADRIDVLDPRVFRFLRNVFFYKRKRIYNTSGSYVNTDYFLPVPFREKENRVVFLGLLSREKQADRLLEMLPEINRKLATAGYSNIKFSILGRCSSDFDPEDVISKWHPETGNQVDYEILEVKDPSETLARSKAFLSLQRTDNYPSKSLLEAMASEVLPIVTRVGNSEMIAPGHLANYVSRTFSAEEIAAGIKEILDLNSQEYNNRASALLSHLRANFSIERSVNYFLELYDLPSATTD